MYRAWALATVGRFREARTIHSELRGELADRGSTIPLASAGIWALEVERLAGDSAAAVPLGKESCRLLEEARER
jgi:hypothetical protein